MRLLRDGAVWIFSIAKGNSLCRARLDAGRRDLSVPDWAVFVFCAILALVNALYTKRAFLHYTGFPHSHIRVELELEWFGPFGL